MMTATTQRFEEYKSSEVNAFPANMIEQVKSLVSSIAKNQLFPVSNDGISVCVENEILKIPYRVYYDKPRLLEAIEISGDIGCMSLCLGTRHHNGFIREECLRRLLLYRQNWAVPFIVQLLGEYVIEVTQPIHEHLSQGVEEKYINFFKHNPAYCRLLEQRAISYWNEYYRHRFPRYTDYPAVKVFSLLWAAVAGQGK